MNLFKVCLVSFLAVVSSMEYKNNGGYKIPVLGLGTFTVSDESELTNAINEALKIGYRHFDTAARYKNEHIIGKVLKEWISSGKVKRDDLFITTKLSPTDLYPDHIESAIKTALEKLQLDYVDLFLIHFPVAIKLEDGKMKTQPTELESVWKKMEEQVDAGRTRTIGLSNCNISQIERIKKIARIQPANLQIELHPYFQQKELRDYASKNNITVVAYSQFGAPGVNTFFKAANMTEIKLPPILQDPVILQIGKKHEKTAAQVVLRYVIQLGVVAIPKSTNPNRLSENFNVFDFVLDKEDMESIEKLDKGKKAKIFLMNHISKEINEHPEYPFSENL